MESASTFVTGLRLFGSLALPSPLFFRLLGLLTSIASGCVVRCLLSLLPMRIALDAMGGDYAPKNTIEGAALALKALPAIEKLVLVGNNPAIEAELQRVECQDSRI